MTLTTNPMIEALQIDPPVIAGLENSLSESIRVLPGRSDSMAVEAAEQILSGRQKPWVELRRGALAIRDSLRLHRRPLNAALGAAVILLLCVAGSLLYRATSIHGTGGVGGTTADSSISRTVSGMGGSTQRPRDRGKRAPQGRPCRRRRGASPRRAIGAPDADRYSQPPAGFRADLDRSYELRRILLRDRGTGQIQRAVGRDRVGRPAGGNGCRDPRRPQERRRILELHYPRRCPVRRQAGRPGRHGGKLMFRSSAGRLTWTARAATRACRSRICSSCWCCAARGWRCSHCCGWAVPAMKRTGASAILPSVGQTLRTWHWRAGRTTAAPVNSADPELNRRLSAAAVAAGISGELASIEPGQPTRVRQTDYTETPVYLRLSAVTLRQLLTFLTDLLHPRRRDAAKGHRAGPPCRTARKSTARPRTVDHGRDPGLPDLRTPRTGEQVIRRRTGCHRADNPADT